MVRFTRPVALNLLLETSVLVTANARRIVQINTLDLFENDYLYRSKHHRFATTSTLPP